MNLNFLKKTASVVTMAALLFSTQIVGQTKIYDENGQWHGLVNMNPDPNGEPWIAGGLGEPTPESRAAYEALPYFKLDPKLRGRKLPATVDHSTNKEKFRPIFNQIGGSCGQASGFGYHFTYERNLALGKALNPNSKENITAYGFTWNFLNRGTGTGSWPRDGYTIASKMGSAYVTDFNNADNGGSQTAWLDGYEGYYNANDCHVTEQVKFDPKDIEAIKNWFYDKGTGTGKDGGMLTFVSNVSFPTQTIASGPFAGEKVCTRLTDGTMHAMTFSGYSDEIGYDINGDGRITNDVDITRDGKIDWRDREQGALQLVNSWGTSWQNKGKVWVLYSGLNCNNVLGIKVAPHTTKLMVKAKLTASNRGNLKVGTGYSEDVNSNAPSSAIHTYGSAYNKSGGSHPLKGSGAGSTLTAGFDCSKFIDELQAKNAKKAKIFLQISGSGTVNEMSAMYYPGGGTNAVEFKLNQTDVNISGTLNLGVVVDLETSKIVDIQKIAGPMFTLRQVGKEYAINLPSKESYTINVTNMMGKTVKSFRTNNTDRVLVSNNLTNGVYFVTAISAKNQAMTKRLDLLRR